MDPNIFYPYFFSLFKFYIAHPFPCFLFCSFGFWSRYSSFSCFLLWCRALSAICFMHRRMEWEREREREREREWEHQREIFGIQCVWVKLWSFTKGDYTTPIYSVCHHGITSHVAYYLQLFVLGATFWGLSWISQSFLGQNQLNELDGFSWDPHTLFQDVENVCLVFYKL